MTLSEEFKKATDESNITMLELSWSFGITKERLQELLEGAQYNDKEELSMFRFVYKTKYTPAAMNHVKQGVSTAEAIYMISEQVKVNGGFADLKPHDGYPNVDWDKVVEFFGNGSKVIFHDDKVEVVIPTRTSD